MKKNILAILIWLVSIASVFADGSSGGGGGGGVGGDYVQSTYIVKATDAGITDENVATAGTGITLTYATVPDPDTLTFAINQAFTPTWTAAHIWSTGTVEFQSAVELDSYIHAPGETAPSEIAGSGIIYYDNTANKWKVSQDAGGFADLVQAGGTDLTAVDFLTGAATGLLSAENVLTDGIGIDTVISAGTAVINFKYTDTLAGSAQTADQVVFGGNGTTNGVLFEGDTSDGHKTLLIPADPSADRTLTLPNVTGSIITTGDSGTVTGTMIAANTVDGTDIAITSQATGDILRYNGTDWVRVGIGAEDDVLTVASGQPAWAANACEAGSIGDISIITSETETTATNEKVLSTGDATAIILNDVPDPDTIQVDWVPDGVTLSVDGSNEAIVLESGVEDLLDLQDLQGAVTDVQVPNTITIAGTDTITLGSITNGSDDTTLVSSGSALVSTAIGDCDDSGGNHLNYDTGTNAFSCGTTSAASAINHSTTFEIFDDFCTASSTASIQIGESGFTATGSGTGTQATVNSVIPDKDHPCVIQLETGTTGTGRTHVSWGAAPMAPTGGAIHAEWLVRFEDLSVAAEEFVIRVGLGDWTSADATDGYYFKYDRLNVGLNWQVVTADSTVLDTADSGVVAAADTWYKFEIDVNTDATSAVYKINGVTVHTEAGTVLEVGDEFGPEAGIVDLADADDLDRVLYIDYAHITKVISR